MANHDMDTSTYANDRPRALPTIALGADLTTIRGNRDRLRAVLVEVDAERRGLQALMRANQAMCDHPNRRNDPRDGWDCPDCDASA
jgi:hypothetical protein